MEGKVVDSRYLIGEQIGKGGFSKVYKAYLIPDELRGDLSRENLKTIPEKHDCEHVIKIANCPDFQFKSEATISQSIQTEKGVVKCVENGEIENEGENFDYIVSKLLKGGELLNYVGRNGMQETKIR